MGEIFKILLFAMALVTDLNIHPDPGPGENHEAQPCIYCVGW